MRRTLSSHIMAAIALSLLCAAPLAAVCAPCQPIANEIKILEQEKKDASQMLKETKGGGFAAQVQKLLKQLTQKKKQLHTCLIEHKCIDPNLMAIDLSLKSFTVNKANEGEGDDDPFLYVVAIFADGSTVNIADLPNSSVRVHSHSKTHNNLGMDGRADDPKTGKAYSIPSLIGHFMTSILPLRGLTGPASKTSSTVTVLVITMEEDNSNDSTADAGLKSLVDNLQKELNTSVRTLTKPNVDDLTSRVKAKVVDAMTKETLKDWWAPWGLLDAIDSDEFVGSDSATFSYAQIQNAGATGLPITLQCKSAEGSYTIKGRIRKQ